MLELYVVLEEGFDDETERFVTLKDVTIKLEHSLVSVSKWESKWEKPFLGKSEKTSEELIDYIKMMFLDPEDHVHIDFLSEKNLREINEYINAKQSAAWINEQPGQKSAPSRKTITADLIYYWMVAFAIPFECQNWHLNRLLTLIRITELENKPKKKMSQKDAMQQHRSLNAQRRRR